MGRTGELLSIANRHLIRFHAVDEEAPVLTRGLGSTVWDVEGKDYIDFVSGQVCATLGHNHPRIVEAIVEACAKQIHCNDFLLSDDPIALAEELAKLLPAKLSKFVFKSTGSEANEVALYMAKAFTDGWEVVSPDRSYYGGTAGARSSTYAIGHKTNAPGVPGTFSLPAPYCYRCPLKKTFPSCDYACIDVGFDRFDCESEGSPAAVIAEPILSGGGIIEPPPGYFQHLQRRARERSMLLILDEAQTGLGRVGSMFAFEQDGVVPDILTLSKTLGGGIPLSCTATSPKIEQRCFDRKFVMGSSHTNDPLPTRVGKAVLQVLQDEKLPLRAHTVGARLRSQLLEFAQKYELIGDIRGRGLLLGVELVRDRNTKEPAEEEGRLFARMCTKMGLIVSLTGAPGRNTVVRIAPALTIADDEMSKGLDIFEAALQKITARLDVSSRLPSPAY
jgi:2,2-dialkylglycine decarboxylase (pyruvate)